MGSIIEEEKEMEPDIATDLVSPLGSTVADLSPTPTPRKTLVIFNSAKSLIASSSSKSLGVSNSGKRFDPTGKKYVKQVTCRHDTKLHLAARRGDLAAVKQILSDIDSQITGTITGVEFDEEVAKIITSVVNEVNQLGETPLFTAAEKGNIDVVKEFLRYTTKESLMQKNRSGFDVLHIACSQGHRCKSQYRKEQNKIVSLLLLLF